MELELAKNENVKAPTTAMRAMVERLKKQLEEKEAKMKALSKALTDLRADMVRSAAEGVKDRARSTEDSLNVQQLAEKQTEDLQVRPHVLLQKSNHEIVLRLISLGEWCRCAAT